MRDNLSDTFFREKMEQVMKKNNVIVPIITRIYLTNLMSSYVNREEEPMKKALCIAYMEAIHSRKLMEFKKIGDFVMMRIGFFPGNLTKRINDIDYFKGIGSASYQEVYNRSSKGKIDNVYKDLADNFNTYTDLLLGMSGLCDDSLKLDEKYNLWVHTKSKILKVDMEKSGIIVVDFENKERFDV